MTHYRAYMLNPAGKIVAGHWLEAENDGAAQVAAHAFCDQATPSVELWQGTRKVALLACRDDEVG